MGIKYMLINTFFAAEDYQEPVDDIEESKQDQEFKPHAVTEWDLRGTTISVAFSKNHFLQTYFDYHGSVDQMEDDMIN